MLYVVGTPIGNLDDLSYRQAKVISNADLVVTEDTRSTGILREKIQDFYNFKINPNQKLLSYYKEREFEKLPEVIEHIESGEEVVLISQAGMPLISDPGYLLIKTIIKKGLPFTVVPGPTASVTALIYSGFNPSKHMFIGFLPKKTSDIKKIFEKIKKIKESMPEMVVIFYESPNRIHETLQFIHEVFLGSEISISREMTKKFEETLRGTAKELKAQIFKGELTVVLQ